ncbi:cysteine-rich CWC family protein [Acidovorax sp.]|uniref:cysteine-rich CWC family protein n=1 Tax=Acidovorax sp. TaxID=1872122 RepID=UPI0025BC24C6|nr:cysteine-rich CWC family protein [Acidovorax sp.]
MPHASLPLQPAQCPICGQANLCAMANGRPAEQCWCMQQGINPQALQELPLAARGTVCICRTCAQQAPHDPRNGAV